MVPTETNDENPMLRSRAQSRIDVQIAPDWLSKAMRPGFAIALKMRARMHRAFERTDQAVEDFFAAIEADPGIVEQSLPALRYAGYWTSAKSPTDFTPEFKDAIHPRQPTHKG